MKSADALAGIAPGTALIVAPEAKPTDPLRPEILSLTKRMTRGEEAAWRLFYAQYHGRLRRYLLVVTRNESAAGEALQQTLLRVVHHVRPFADETAFWSWLTVLARSAAADHGRKHRRYFAFLGRFFVHTQTTTDAVGDADGRLLEMLNAGLQGLDSNERRLVEQKYLETRSVRDIAASLHTTEKAIEARLVRVRQKLKSIVLAKLSHETDT